MINLQRIVFFLSKTAKNTINSIIASENEQNEGRGPFFWPLGYNFSKIRDK